jgi:hypothetical protein
MRAVLSSSGIICRVPLYTCIMSDLVKRRIAKKSIY